MLGAVHMKKFILWFLDLFIQCLHVFTFDFILFYFYTALQCTMYIIIVVGDLLASAIIIIRLQRFPPKNIHIMWNYIAGSTPFHCGSWFVLPVNHKTCTFNVFGPLFGWNSVNNNLLWPVHYSFLENVRCVCLFVYVCFGVCFSLMQIFFNPDHQRAPAEAISILSYRTGFYHVKMQSYGLVEVLALQIFIVMPRATHSMTTNHMKVTYIR